MSYCRFCEGDVYAYACEGGVQFFVAGDSKKLDRLCGTYDAAYQYAKYLRDECGLDVPSHAIEALRADALDESNHGDGSAVAELVSENAKLREFAKMFAQVADEVGCDHCPYCDPDLCDEETDPMKDGCRLYKELRELGVTDD